MSGLLAPCNSAVYLHAMRAYTKPIVTLAVSAVCTGALFWAIGREVSFSKLGEIFSGTDRELLLCFCVLSLCGMLVRALRYQLVFRGFAGVESQPLRFSDVAAVTAIRNAMVDLVPARAGELLTVYFLKQIAVPLVTAGHSIIALFVLDAAVLCVITAVVALIGWIDGGQISPGGGALVSFGHLFAISLFAAVSGMFLFLNLDLVVLKATSLLRAFRRERAGAGGGYLSQDASSVESEDLRGQSHRTVEGISETIRADYQSLRGSGLIIKIAGVTFVLRALKYSGLYLLLLAVVSQWQVGAADIPFPAAFICFVAAEAASTLPASGLLGFGAYEGGWAVIFKYLALKPLPVFSVIFAVHVITQVVALFLAVVGFGWISRVNEVRIGIPGGSG
jgi:hypothetical protein